MSNPIPFPPAVPWESVERVISRAEERFQAVLGEFACWLRDVRQLATGSISLRILSVSRFLHAFVTESAVEFALADLTPATLDDVFVEIGRDLGYQGRRSMQAGLRLFLRFAGDRGWVDLSLAGMVPRIRTPRDTRLPRGLQEQQIATLLSSVSGSSPGHIRDRAILVLLAVYGARRGQVATLRLQDIDWKNQTIRFPAHKGGKPVVHVLHPTACNTLACYIEKVRPTDLGPALFFRLHPKPILPLRPGAISTMVYLRLKAAGIEAPSRGPHALRHAFATRVLQAGRSLKEIADLLGHRHLDSASIYAKVDDRGLRVAALQWPEVLR